MAETNQDTSQGWHFHNATKYIVADNSFLMGDLEQRMPAMGEQDPANEPHPYKIYTSLDPIPLPRPEAVPTMSALDAVASTGDLGVAHAVPDLATIARLCLRSNGLLKRGSHGTGRVIEYRAAGCTGARYHLELYLVSSDLPNLAAGIYHYAAHDHTLRCLRSGDYRSAVVAASGGEPAITSAPVIAVITSTFWRNAWRYQARAYRHVYWDTGTVLANLLAVAADARLPSRVVLGYVDAEINALLGVDGTREAAVALVALGRADSMTPSAPAVTPLHLPTEPISASEVEFPAITQMHLASSLQSSAEVESWRRSQARPVPDHAAAPSIRLRPIPADLLPTDSIDQVIARRRSNRYYDAEKPLSFEAFSTVLTFSRRGADMDCLPVGRPPLTSRFLLVNNVQDVDPGVYLVDVASAQLSLLNPGDVQDQALELACYQDYARDAHVNAYEMANLADVFATFGNRGYRVAQLEAALAGARLQLAAHALRLGAVGSTSLDDRVTELLTPEAKDLSFMFIAVFGERRPRSEPD